MLRPYTCTSGNATGREADAMDFSVDAAVEVLTRTPGTLRTMLSGLPSPWTSGKEGPDTWSPQDVVGHLIHGEETDWIPRAKIILTKGESQAFEPFHRFAHAPPPPGPVVAQPPHPRRPPPARAGPPPTPTAPPPRLTPLPVHLPQRRSSVLA